MPEQERPYIFQTDPMRRLVKKIEEVRAMNYEAIASNANCVVPNDLVATGGNYFAATRYVAALNDVLAWCEQVETDIYTGK